jgi:hypothetical protein
LLAARWIAFATSSLDVDTTGPFNNREGSQAEAIVGGADTSSDVVLDSMPGAHQVDLGIVETLPDQSAPLNDPSYSSYENPGANRTPLVLANILVCQELISETEDPNFDAGHFHDSPIPGWKVRGQTHEPLR